MTMSGCEARSFLHRIGAQRAQCRKRAPFAAVCARHVHPNDKSSECDVTGASRGLYKADSWAEPTARKDRIYNMGIVAFLIRIDHRPSSGANIKRV